MENLIDAITKAKEGKIMDARIGVLGGGNRLFPTIMSFINSSEGTQSLSFRQPGQKEGKSSLKMDNVEISIDDICALIDILTEFNHVIIAAKEPNQEDI